MNGKPWVDSKGAVQFNNADKDKKLFHRFKKKKKTNFRRKLEEN